VDEVGRRTLVTGFGPFGTVGQNPSEKLARQCGSPNAILEVSYSAVDAFLESSEVQLAESMLLMGVAASRPTLSIEKFARNHNGHHPDVEGQIRAGQISEEGPLLLEGNYWCPEAIAAEIVADPRIKLSMDAGGYLCNYIFYSALARFPSKRIGFLHVALEERVPIGDQLSIVKRLIALAAGCP
jgi:pyroglutamyl-peptidase